MRTDATPAPPTVAVAGMRHAELLPCRPLAANGLYCEVDKPGATRLDIVRGELTLAANLLALFDDGPVTALTLVGVDRPEQRFEVGFTATLSSWLGTRWAPLAWAAKARLVIDTKIQLGRDAERIYTLQGVVEGRTAVLARLLILERAGPQAAEGSAPALPWPALAAD